MNFIESLFMHVHFGRIKRDHGEEKMWEDYFQEKHPGTRGSCPECKKSGKMNLFYDVLTLKGEIVGSSFFTIVVFAVIVYIIKVG
jgi:hypothetical protein